MEENASAVLNNLLFGFGISFFNRVFYHRKSNNFKQLTLLRNLWIIQIEEIMRKKYIPFHLLPK